jgi:long-chain acyl-CoA synthetase
MKTLLNRIRSQGDRLPGAIALRDERGDLDYGELLREVDRLAGMMTGERIGLLLDNGIPWACLDLAILQREAVCIPMPAFFSNDQLRHLIEDADLDLIVTDQPERVATLLAGEIGLPLHVAGRALGLFLRQARKFGQILPMGTAKVTYTSGTTGQPKGVCLSSTTMESVTASLCESVAANTSDRSLALLPLSTLLENIAGLYAPLWVGALAQIPSLASCGFTGSSSLQTDRLFAVLMQAEPSIILLVPQLLKVIVGGIVAGQPMPASLRFVAVGGAPVAESLLQSARLFGLPVFQGFGLSEAGSVACLNLPGAERLGSVGKALPHIGISIADDGEVVVNGDLFLGYLGATGDSPSRVWHSGDLGYLDEDGYLFLTGRKKTVYSTAFGRNVAPEWVESALIGHPYIVQAAVFGEGRPYNVAILVTAPEVAAYELKRALETVNSQLPDYARIGGWIPVEAPFTVANGQLNRTGSIHRQAIGECYRQRIEQIYSAENSYAFL